MSRLKTLNGIKRKKFIKVVMGSLALMLVIGISNNSTTYALFSDFVTIKDDLSISTGDVEVSVDNGFHLGNLEFDNNPIKKEFHITNKGTLRQQLKLQFNNSNLDELNEYINYNLSIKTSQGQIVTIGEDGRLIDQNGKNLILESDDYLDCTSTIMPKKGLDEEQKINLGKAPIQFDINVSVSQIGSGKGFTDSVVQNNLVSFSKLVLEPNLKVDSSVIGNIRITIPSHYKAEEVELIGGVGQFKKDDIYIHKCHFGNDKSFTIMKHGFLEQFKRDKFNLGQVSEDFDGKNSITVRLAFKDGTEETWKIKFKFHNNKLEAHYEVINKSVFNNILKDEQNLTKQKVIETNKLQIEKPMCPVVEESKELEIHNVKQEEITEQRNEEAKELENKENTNTNEIKIEKPMVEKSETVDLVNKKELTTQENEKISNVETKEVTNQEDKKANTVEIKETTKLENIESNNIETKTPSKETTGIQE